MKEETGNFREITSLLLRVLNLNLTLRSHNTLLLSFPLLPLPKTILPQGYIFLAERRTSSANLSLILLLFLSLPGLQRA